MKKEHREIYAVNVARDIDEITRLIKTIKETVERVHGKPIDSSVERYSFLPLERAISNDGKYDLDLYDVILHIKEEAE